MTYRTGLYSHKFPTFSSLFNCLFFSWWDFGADSYVVRVLSFVRLAPQLYIFFAY
jgi:hypothetical protein